LEEGKLGSWENVGIAVKQPMLMLIFLSFTITITIAMATIPANIRKAARSGELDAVRRLPALCKRPGFEARTFKEVMSSILMIHFAVNPPENIERYREWRERKLICA